MSINNDYKIDVIPVVKEENETIKNDYNFNFYISKPTDLKIKIINTNGTVTDLQYNTNYIVKNKFDYFNGGEFTLTETPTVGQQIVVYRETPIEQQINFRTLQAISPMNLTKMFDKLTTISQEINVQANRAIKFDFQDISKIDQTKPLNEINIKNLNQELNKTNIVAVTLNCEKLTEQEKNEGKKPKWILSTSKTDPDDKKEQGTEQTHGVYKIATQDEVTDGTNNDKVITPLKLKTELDLARKSTTEDITTGENNNKYITPFGLKEELDRRQATYTDVYSAENINKYVNPAQLNLTIMPYSNTRIYAKGDMCYQLDNTTSKPYIYYSLIDNNLNHQVTEIDYWKSFDINGENIMQIATTEEVILGINDEKAVSPLKLKNELDNRLLMELKSSYQISDSVSTIEFTSLNYNYEHVFLLTDLFTDSTSHRHVYCQLGIGNEPYIDSVSYYWSSSMRNCTNDFQVNNYSTTSVWNNFILTSYGDANTGIKNNACSNLEIHLYPNYSDHRYLTSKFMTTFPSSTTPNFYVTNSSCVLYNNTSNGRVDKLKLWIENGSLFTNGRIKHYVIKN